MASFVAHIVRLCGSKASVLRCHHRLQRASPLNHRRHTATAALAGSDTRAAMEASL
jgi:hypothetical protein